ncbi:MAG TPA: response regulator [Longimicrobiales bacterium]|nr:response regulator [Longimicrobiales bacterium]
MYAPIKNRVMVVDDEATVRDSWNRYLTQSGFEVVTAEDGKTAVSELSKKPVDVVISDLRMPGIDGLQLLEWVHDRKPDTPFILLTGYGNEEVERKAKDLGAYGYLNKPISPEALSLMLTGALVQKAAEEKKAKAMAAVAEALPLEAEARPLELVVPEVKPAARKTLVQTAGGLVLAPIVGLMFVIALPVIGFGMLFKVGLEALRKK